MTRADHDERDAARFRALQRMNPIHAQAFFWNHSSRKARAKAIDAWIAANPETYEWKFAGPSPIKDSAA